MNKIQIKQDNNIEVKNIVWEGLCDYNNEKCESMRKDYDGKEHRKIDGTFALYDGEEIVGGAIGYIEFGWYQLTDFWIKEEYRNKDFGSQIINNIENFAKENNAIGVKMGSWSFQAPKFYKKLGYKLWGVFKDCPPGTSHYYFYKKLKK